VRERKHRRPTINNIADVAGVSRGTVDRALNNRPGVNQRLAEKIRRIACDLGYAPNRAAKALRFNYEPQTIGVILPAANEFFDDVVRGIKRAEEELHGMGVHAQIETIDESDESAVVNTMMRLSEETEASGLVMTGPDTSKIRTAINSIADTGIPVVTINSDISAEKRLCFVGQDLRKSGLVAAELLAKLVPTPGTVVAVTGDLNFQAHRDRIVGFQEGMEKWGKHLKVAVGEGYDSYQGTLRCVNDAFSSAAHSGTEVVGVYMATGSIDGCLEAVNNLTAGNRPRIVTNDILPAVEAGLADGRIDFTIFQDPEYQGYMPMKVIYEYLLTKRMPESHWFQSPIRILGAADLE